MDSARNCLVLLQRFLNVLRARISLMIIRADAVNTMGELVVTITVMILRNSISKAPSVTGVNASERTLR